MLNANTGAGLSYQWQNNGTNISGATTASYTASATGVYTVVVTNSSGCSVTSAATTITANALPSVNAGADQAICKGSSATLTGAGADTYVWDNGVSNGISFLPTTSATYTVTGTNSTTGCSNTDQVVVTVNMLPIVTLSSFNDVCDTSGLIQLTGGLPLGGTYTGQGVSTNMFNTGIGIGAYTITYTYTDNNFCSDSTSQTLTVIHCSGAGIEEQHETSVMLYPNPSFNILFVKSTEEWIGSSFELTDIAGKAVLQGKLISDLQSFDIAMLASGSYYFNLANSSGLIRINLVKQ